MPALLPRRPQATRTQLHYYNDTTDTTDTSGETPGATTATTAPRSAASRSLPQQLQDTIPSCAQSCLQTYIQQQYGSCSSESFDCLCAAYSSGGYTVGELALICLDVFCPSPSVSPSPAEQEYVYEICSAQVGAVSPTHSTLTVPATTATSTRHVTTTAVLVHPTSTHTSRTSDSSSSVTTTRTSMTESEHATSTSTRTMTTHTTSAAEVTSSSRNTMLTSAEAVGVSVGAFAGLALVIALIWLCVRIRRRRKQAVKQEDANLEKRRGSYDFVDNAPPRFSPFHYGHADPRGPLGGFQDRRVELPSSDERHRNEWYREQFPSQPTVRAVEHGTPGSLDSQRSNESMRTVSQLLPDRPETASPRPPPPLVIVKEPVRQSSARSPNTIFEEDRSPRAVSTQMIGMRPWPNKPAGEPLLEAARPPTLPPPPAAARVASTAMFAGQPVPSAKPAFSPPKLVSGTSPSRSGAERTGPATLFPPPRAAARVASANMFTAQPTPTSEPLPPLPNTDAPPSSAGSPEINGSATLFPPLPPEAPRVASTNMFAAQPISQAEPVPPLPSEPVAAASSARSPEISSIASLFPPPPPAATRVASTNMFAAQTIANTEPTPPVPKIVTATSPDRNLRIRENATLFPPSPPAATRVASTNMFAAQPTSNPEPTPPVPKNVTATSPDRNLMIRENATLFPPPPPAATRVASTNMFAAQPISNPKQTPPVPKVVAATSPDRNSGTRENATLFPQPPPPAARVASTNMFAAQLAPSTENVSPPPVPAKSRNPKSDEARADRMLPTPVTMRVASTNMFAAQPISPEVVPPPPSVPVSTPSSPRKPGRRQADSTQLIGLPPWPNKPAPVVGRKPSRQQQQEPNYTNRYTHSPDEIRQPNLSLDIPQRGRRTNNIPSPISIQPPPIPSDDRFHDSEDDLDSRRFRAKSGASSAGASLLSYYASPEAGRGEHYGPLGSTPLGSPLTPISLEPQWRNNLVPTAITITKPTYPPRVIVARSPSAGSATSFESADPDEPTPPEEDEKHLSPVAEHSPIAAIRYPKVPRSSNQAVPRTPPTPRHMSPREATNSSLSPSQQQRWQDDRKALPSHRRQTSGGRGAATISPTSPEGNIIDASSLSGSTLKERRQADSGSHEPDRRLVIDTSHSPFNTRGHAPQLVRSPPRKSADSDLGFRNKASTYRQDSPLKGYGKVANYSKPNRSAETEMSTPAGKLQRRQDGDGGQEVVMNSPLWEPKLTPSRRGEDLYLEVGLASPAYAVDAKGRPIMARML